MHENWQNISATLTFKGVGRFAMTKCTYLCPITRPMDRYFTSTVSLQQVRPNRYLKEKRCIQCALGPRTNQGNQRFRHAEAEPEGLVTESPDERKFGSGSATASLRESFEEEPAEPFEEDRALACVNEPLWCRRDIPEEEVI